MGHPNFSIEVLKNNRRSFASPRWGADVAQDDTSLRGTENSSLSGALVRVICFPASHPVRDVAADKDGAPGFRLEEGARLKPGFVVGESFGFPLKPKSGLNGAPRVFDGKKKRPVEAGRFC